jgi:hypothetical protein
VRALVWHGPGKLSVDELPDPVPAADEVLLAPAAASVAVPELTVLPSALQVLGRA